MNRLWEIFSQFLMWEIWHEHNSRIFREKASLISTVWDSMASKMHETILMGKWEKIDWDLTGNER